MNSGGLPQPAVRGWVANRFYYQTSIPIKDPLNLRIEDFVLSVQKGEPTNKQLLVEGMHHLSTLVDAARFVS